MRATYLAAAALLLHGCADMAEPRVDPKDQAVDDYIQVGELQSQDKVRMSDHDSWTYVTEHYAIYRGRDGEYLFKFRRRCVELRDNTRVTPDQRFDNQIRRKVDTLRGCLIEDIYPLTEAQAEELRNLPEAPLEGTRTRDPGSTGL